MNMNGFCIMYFSRWWVDYCKYHLKVFENVLRYLIISYCILLICYLLCHIFICSCILQSFMVEQQCFSSPFLCCSILTSYNIGDDFPNPKFISNRCYNIVCFLKLGFYCKRTVLFLCHCYLYYYILIQSVHLSIVTSSSVLSDPTHNKSNSRLFTR